MFDPDDSVDIGLGFNLNNFSYFGEQIFDGFINEI